MNTFQKVKMFVRDLFMPRYALTVVLHSWPNMANLFDSTEPRMLQAPVIMHCPYRRPFFMPFNNWYNGMREDFGLQTMTICGSKRTLMALYGVGSVLPHNMKNATIYIPRRYSNDKQDRYEEVDW